MQRLRSLATVVTFGFALSLAAAAALAATPPPPSPSTVQEAKSACARMEYTAATATAAPLPTRLAIRKIETTNRIAPPQNLLDEGLKPLRSYARFYTARHYHGRLWYCGTFTDQPGHRPGVYLGGIGEIIDGGCDAGHLAFDATAGRFAFIECNGR